MAASLLLSRLSAWFRMSFDGGPEYGLVVQLEALEIFLWAPAGTEFVAEFAESGGLQTLLDVLRLDSLDVAPEAHEAALRLLQCVAVAGRPYKEEICELGGVLVVAGCMVGQSKHAVNERGRNLLIEVALGNPKCLHIVVAVRASARSVRSTSRCVLLTPMVNRGSHHLLRSTTTELHKAWEHR